MDDQTTVEKPRPWRQAARASQRWLTWGIGLKRWLLLLLIGLGLIGWGGFHFF